MAKGERYLSGDLALKLAFARATRVDPVDSLTGRELEILRNFVDGKDVAEVAHWLNVSYQTVASNRRLIKAKLGARSKADQIRIAVQHRASGKLGLQ